MDFADIFTAVCVSQGNADIMDGRGEAQLEVLAFSYFTEIERFESR